MENAKMRKTAVVMDKILKVLQGVAAACGIVYLIFTVLTLLNKSMWKISTVMGLVLADRKSVV